MYTKKLFFVMNMKHKLSCTQQSKNTKLHSECRYNMVNNALPRQVEIKNILKHQHIIPK